MPFLGEIQFHEVNEPASYPEILSKFAKQNMFILNKKKNAIRKKNQDLKEIIQQSFHTVFAFM